MPEKVKDITFPGMTGYVQCHATDRFVRGYKDKDGEWDAYTVKAKDVAITGDPIAPKASGGPRERCEFRQGWDKEGCDLVGSTVSRSGQFKNGPGYPYFSPKQTWLQPAFDLDQGYPLAFLRIEGTTMVMLVNYKTLGGVKKSWSQTFPVPFHPDTMHDWESRFRYVPGDADFYFEVDGKVICDIRNDPDLVQPGSDLFYFKGGVYRSSADIHPDYPNHPDQTVLHRYWTRDVEAEGQAPEPVEKPPAPQQPDPEPSTGTPPRPAEPDVDDEDDIPDDLKPVNPATALTRMRKINALHATAKKAVDQIGSETRKLERDILSGKIK